MLEIETITTKHFRAELPAAHITIKFDAEEDKEGRYLTPDAVSLIVPDEEGNPHRVEVAPVNIERAAQLMRRIRSETGDFRDVCDEHGYYDWRSSGCPKCKPVEPEAKTETATPIPPAPQDIPF